MRAASISTRRLTGLDYRVWMVVLLTWVLCLGLFGYKKLSGDGADIQTCSENIRITVNSKEEAVDICYVNRISIFQLQTTPVAKAEWDFGDGTPGVSGTIVQHKYVTEGAYTVVIRINGRCRFTQEVKVKEVFASMAERTLPQIIPDSANPKAGNTVRFYAVSDPPPETFEWKLVGMDDVQRAAVASFTFPAAGKYTVQLVINNDPSTVRQKTIDVADIPLPPTNFPLPGGSGVNPMVPTQLFPAGDPAGNNTGQKPPPAAQNTVPPETPKTEVAKPKATGIDPETFKSLLQEVLNGNKEVSELYQYLDYAETTIVRVNGKDEMKLPAFCREKAKKKIDTLDFKRDDKNSIQKILVKLKKGGILGLW